MKRIALLLLALGLMLSACGQAEPEPTTTTVTQASIIEAEISTEEATTVPALLASGESNGVRWRTLDLVDGENAELKAWLEEWRGRWDFESKKEDGAEVPMGKDKTVVRKGTYQAGQLILRNNATGKETILLEDVYFGESDNPQQDEMLWKSPICLEALDDRYFVFYWAGWSWSCGISVYDTKEMKEIPITNKELSLIRVQGDYLYFVDVVSEEDYYGPPQLWAYDWTAVKRGEPVKSTDLLAGFNGTDTISDQVLLTDDLRYYLALERLDSPDEDRLWLNGLRIYDLAGKKLLTTLPEPDFSVDKLEEWNGKVYWVKYDNPDYALEITLP